MGRPKKPDNEKGQKTHIYMPNTLLAIISKAIKRLNVSRSKFITQATKEKLIRMGLLDEKIEK